MQPLVGVIVVSWNAGADLLRCLRQLNTQTVIPHRVIVVDNASADGSIESIPVADFESLEIMRLQRNVGFAAGNNVGLERVADCQWIALLNPDAFPEPTWLENLLGAAQENLEYQYFASRQLSERKPDRLDGCGDAYHVSGLHWRIGYGRKAQGFREAGHEVFGPCAAAALYRADILREVGGFDTSFFCYGEDVDLAFRLRLRGYRCYYVPTAVVRHIGSAVTGRRSEFTIYHGHRNLVWVYVKNMPGMLFWLYLPQHLLINVLTIVWFAIRGQARVILRAKWDALMGLPRILRDRGAVQSARRVGARRIREAMVTGLFSAILWRRA